MKLIFRYLRPVMWFTLATLFVKLLGSLMELTIPMIFDYLLSSVVPLRSLPLILVWGGMMILAAGLTMMLNIVANRMASKVSRDITERIRHDLFTKTMALLSGLKWAAEPCRISPAFRPPWIRSR